MALSVDNLSQRKLENYQKWASVVAWGRRNPSRFAETFLGIEFMDYQRAIFDMSFHKQFVLWLMSRNGGKALSIDTNIPTVNGNKKMIDIQVGDYVLDENMNPVRVKFTSDIFYNHKCYEIKFDDGETIVSDEDHLWNIRIDSSVRTLELKEIVKLFKGDMSIPNVKSGFKKITSITEVESVPTKCIGVDSDNHLYLCGNKYTVTHNSTLSAPFAMTKMMLFPNFEAYILSLTSAQSQDTFLDFWDSK